GACAFCVSSPSMRAHPPQGNRPLSYSASAMANAWASHGARKTGPFASRGMPGSASAARWAVCGSMDDDSDMFEIRLKRFDGNLQLWLRARAPKLLGIEAHGIKPLRVLAFAGNHGVGKNVSAMQALDHPHVSARIAW